MLGVSVFKLTAGLALCFAGTGSSTNALHLEYMTDPVTGEMAPLPPADVPTLPDVREQTPLHLQTPLPPSRACHGSPTWRSSPQC